MISSGQPVNEYIDGAVRHVMLRQGVLGIKVGLCSEAPNAGHSEEFKWCSRWRHIEHSHSLLGPQCEDVGFEPCFARPPAGEDHEDA